MPQKIGTKDGVAGSSASINSKKNFPIKRKCFFLGSAGDATVHSTVETVVSSPSNCHEGLFRRGRMHDYMHALGFYRATAYLCTGRNVASFIAGLENAYRTK